MQQPGSPRQVHALESSDGPLADAYDVTMLDLDGVVYRGEAAVAGAVEALEVARASTTLAYVTNNASRPPQAVAHKLRGLGVPAEDGDVVTSAQAAARMVSEVVPAGSTVLVVGGEGLEAALAELGLRSTRSLDDGPAAVVQGFHPTIGWELLAEGTYAVASGLPWIASNTDMTVPTARGVAPGNGTLVAAIATATGRTPDVAGKPRAPLFDETVLRVGGRHPLMVGDRLDTDIEGANVVGADSLFVLTGVSTLADAVAADPVRRPTYVSADLAGLLHAHPEVAGGQDGSVTCGGVRVAPDGSVDVGDAAGAPGATCLLRAALTWGWAQADAGSSPDLGPAHDALAALLG
ncbi:HAD-IIA family hydrolase [Solicola sp. PLA-1-18]|uniref:HAD-IIA family hydrolase n=1 Tax=Solicola sp. PLA-1-18 TaxID=3380532 RepID=UPI003B7E6EDC